MTDTLFQVTNGGCWTQLLDSHFFNKNVIVWETKQIRFCDNNPRYPTGSTDLTQLRTWIIALAADHLLTVFNKIFTAEEMLGMTHCTLLTHLSIFKHQEQAYHAAIAFWGSRPNLLLLSACFFLYFYSCFSRISVCKSQMHTKGEIFEAWNRSW